MNLGDLKFLLAAGICCATLGAQTPPARPRILGISHAGFYTSHVVSTKAFWEDLLGFQSPYALRTSDGGIRIVFIKINNRQHIELFNQAPPAGHGYFSHIAFITDDARRMYTYLSGRGVKVPAHWGQNGATGKGRTGDLNFEVRDPDGHLVEFVQYMPSDWRSRHLDRDMPPTRISTQIMHAGFTVGDVRKSEAFYEGILGFHNFWQGSANHGRSLSWVDLRVPNGRDYIELMLYRRLPPPAELGGKNHVCLEVPDVRRAVKRLESQPAFRSYGRALTAKIGVNGKWQANLYDPDGTRVELMETKTYNGRPVPPSSAPLPR